MGTTKSLAEKIFINAPERSNQNNTKFTVVRFGNVFGTAGSVIETFYRQIATNNKITITDENISRYFISVSDACDLVLNCITLTGGESETPIFILKMKKAKIKDIAKKMSDIIRPGKDFNYEIVGLTPGEKFDEILVSSEELKYCKDDKKYIIITREVQETSIDNTCSFMNNKEIEKMINDWLLKNKGRLVS